jgi:hypothetical protein
MKIQSLALSLLLTTPTSLWAADGSIGDASDRPLTTASSASTGAASVDTRDLDALFQDPAVVKVREEITTKAKFAAAMSFFDIDLSIKPMVEASGLVRALPAIYHDHLERLLRETYEATKTEYTTKLPTQNEMELHRSLMARLMGDN